MARFCSSQCYGISKRGKPPHNLAMKTGPKPRATLAGNDVPCAACGATVYVEPNQRGRKKYCSKACLYAGRKPGGLFQKGHVDLVPPESRGHSPATRQKMVAAHRASPRRGPENPNWRGGCGRTERKIAMATREYREWRVSVFARDNHTCTFCHRRGGELHADHIKPWALYPEIRYSEDNGRTLCVPCHRSTPTWGGASRRSLQKG
mgnify:CR=1 FL=1